MVDGEEDGEAGDCEYATEEDEREAETCVVRCVCCDEAEGQCGPNRGARCAVGFALWSSQAS